MKHRLLIPLLALLATPLFAHEVWIEDTPGGALVVRFAEFGDDYEKSPGALDALALPAAFTFAEDTKPKTIASEKKADHFLITGAAPKAAALIETAFGVMGGGDKPARKPFFYARWQPAGAGAAQAALTFDIVPTAQPGEARITFRGQPLAGAKATAYLPDGAEQELTSDAAGLIRVPVEKPGLYLLACKHQREEQKGYSGGKAYDSVSHNCSLAWRIPTKTP